MNLKGGGGELEKSLRFFLLLKLFFQKLGTEKKLTQLDIFKPMAECSQGTLSVAFLLLFKYDYSRASEKRDFYIIKFIFQKTLTALETLNSMDEYFQGKLKDCK